MCISGKGSNIKNWDKGRMKGKFNINTRPVMASIDIIAGAIKQVMNVKSL